MTKLRNTFVQGKMNKDIDERLLPKGQYRDAVNVRVINTDGESSAAVKDAMGNNLLTDLPTATTIGSTSDTLDDTIYWANVTDDNKSYIYEYDYNSKRTTTLLADSRTNSVLNFNKGKRVSMNVFHDPSKGITFLAFTDGLNPPRLLNVNRAKGYGENGFIEDDISLYKKPPYEAPKANYLNIPNLDDNNVKNNFFAFAYRYKYLDGMYSAPSSFTNYRFSPGNFDLDFDTFQNNGMVNSFNAYNITYNTGSKRVTAIEILFKTSNSNTIFKSEEINKEEMGFIDNVDKTYLFLHNKQYEALPSDEISRLFDNSPLTAFVQTFIEGRLMYSNYTEGRDITLTEGSKSKIPIDFKLGFNTSDNFGETLSTSITGLGTALVIDFGDIDLIENNTISFFISIFFVSSSGAFRDGSFTHLESLILNRDFIDATDLANSTLFSDFLTTLSIRFSQEVEATPPSDESSTTYGNFTLSPQPSTATTITIVAPDITYSLSSGGVAIDIFLFRNVENVITYKFAPSNASVKSNRTYEAGLVYLDSDGRYTTVLTPRPLGGVSNNSINIPIANSTNINTLTAQVSSKPPYFADRYKFFIKENKNEYQTIFATIFYEEDLYRWVYLDGANRDKVKEGDTLIVKSDDNGPLDSVIKTKVLETKTFAEKDWIKNNADVDDNPIKEIAGLYMKIKPIGFTLNKVSVNNKSYEGRDNKGISPSRHLILMFPSVFKGLGNTESLFGYEDPDNPDNFIDFDIRKGSVISMKIVHEENSNVDFNYSIEKAAAKNYTGIVDGKSPFEQWLSSELSSFWIYNGTGKYYADADYKIKLTFFDYGNGINLLRVYSTNNKSILDKGSLSAELSIQFVDNITIFETEPKDLNSDIYYETEKTFKIENGFHLGGSQDQTASQDAICEIPFHNCFSFGNGLESYRIRDEFNGNALNIDLRPNASLQGGYGRKVRTTSITWGDVFQPNTNYNGLNEFNLSKKNFKEIDRQYGSIQEIIPRFTNLLIFQEDRVSKALYGKGLLYNADGTTNLAAIDEIIGTVIPFKSEHGIGKHPESIAEYEGRVYFADATRGVVLRLSQDGITPISNYGMFSFFKDKLPLASKGLILGGYDPKRNQYVISYDDAPPAIESEIDEYGCGSTFTMEMTQGETYTYKINVGNKKGDVRVVYELESATAPPPPPPPSVTILGVTASQVNGNITLTAEDTNFTGSSWVWTGGAAAGLTTKTITITETSAGSVTYGVTVNGAYSDTHTVEWEVPSLNSVNLEYGSGSCANVCSNYGTGSNNSGTFYLDVGVFAIASVLYTNPEGTNTASANFYSDGTICRPTDGSGNLGVETPCSIPTTTTTTTTSTTTTNAQGGFTLEYGSGSCENVCSNYGTGVNNSGIFYTDVGVFDIGNILYTDAARTQIAVSGFYSNGSTCRPVDGSGNLGTTSSC